MPNYPLYEMLKEQVEGKNPSYTVDHKTIAHTINQIATRCSTAQAWAHYEEIATIIYHHHVLENTGIVSSGQIYGSKVMPGGKGLLFNISQLPIYLLKIISVYLEYYAHTS